MTFILEEESVTEIPETPEGEEYTLYPEWAMVKDPWGLLAERLRRNKNGQMVGVDLETHLGRKGRKRPPRRPFTGNEGEGDYLKLQMHAQNYGMGRLGQQLYGAQPNWAATTPVHPNVAAVLEDLLNE